MATEQEREAAQQRAERDLPPAYRWTQHTTAECRAQDRDDYLCDVIVMLYAARANARELAHAYTHDSRPRPKVVAEALAYPIDPARPNEVPLVVAAFDERSWWGVLQSPDGDLIRFHATCAVGWRTGDTISAGAEVTAVFSDAQHERLLSVIINSGPNAVASPRARASTARKPKTKGVRARGAGVRR
jgi:hypothetical protein